MAFCLEVIYSRDSDLLILGQLDRSNVIIYNFRMIEIILTDELVKWIKWLKDVCCVSSILVRTQHLLFAGNFGEARLVGEGAFEMRIDMVLAPVSNIC